MGLLRCNSFMPHDTEGPKTLNFAYLEPIAGKSFSNVLQATVPFKTIINTVYSFLDDLLNIYEQQQYKFLSWKAVTCHYTVPGWDDFWDLWTDFCFNVSLLSIKLPATISSKLFHLFLICCGLRHKISSFLELFVKSEHKGSETGESILSSQSIFA